MFSEAVDAILAYTDIRLAAGGATLSSEAAQICAVLLLMPDPRVETAIDLAKRIGTYGKLDRSAQYKERYDSETLLRNDNLQFKQIRELQSQRTRDKIYLILAYVLAPVLAAWLGRFFR